MIRYLFIFCLLFAGTAAHSQDLGLSMDRTRILIGEPIQVKLQAEFAAEPVSWFQIDSFPHFEILERSKIDTVREGSRIRLLQTLTITSWDSGKWNVPPFPLGANTTGPVAVTVGHTPMDYSQPYHDIRDILDVKPERDSNWFWYFLFAMVLIALFMLFFPAGEKKKDVGFVPAPGAYRDALHRLDALKKKKGEDPKLFYTELVEIFRDYLSRRKNIRSHAQTTDDLAVRIKALDLPQEQYAELVQTLRLSDLAKFAKYRPEESELAGSVDSIGDSIANIEQMRTEVTVN